ncbi:MAG: hypothetical protein WBD99_03125 [Thermodesulfobacteriota bacterium]
MLSIDSTVAISSLSLEELGYFDEEKENDKKEEADDEETTKTAYKSQFACLAPSYHRVIILKRWGML